MMASGLYESGINAIMKGNIDLVNSSITAILINSSLYSVDLANDSNQDDIPDSAQIASASLTGKTVDGSKFTANDTVFSSVESDYDVDAVVLILDTDYEDTSTLIAYLDNAGEFPITPDGTNITIVWDTGANGIFKLYLWHNLQI